MDNSPNGILFGLPKVGTAYAFNPLKNECHSYHYDFVFGRVIFVTQAECEAACMDPIRENEEPHTPRDW